MLPTIRESRQVEPSWVNNLVLNTNRPRIGDSIRFSYDLCVNGDETTLLRQEFIVTYMKARGTSSSAIINV